MLHHPLNGRVESSSTDVGSSAVYTCNTGYRLVGTITAECRSDGQWSNDAPVCERKTYTKANVYDKLLSVL